MARSRDHAFYARFVFFAETGHRSGLVKATSAYQRSLGLAPYRSRLGVKCTTIGSNLLGSGCLKLKLRCRVIVVPRAIPTTGL